MPLSSIAAPDHWTYEPLWSLAPRVSDKGYPDAEPLSVFLGAGVVPRSSRADNHNELGADLSAYLRVLPGDLVFNKLRTWQGGLGLSAHEGIVSPAYFVCRPRPGVVPRFMHYLLLSAPYAAELARLSKWMPPSQFDIPWESLRTLPLLLAPLEEQSRIADFLDEQVGLLITALALREEQRQLLAERAQAALDIALDAAFEEQGTLRAGYVIRAIEQGWSPQCDAVPAEPTEFGVLKVGAVKHGAFVPSENKRLPSELEPQMQYLVRPGDLLMTRANTPKLVGDVAVVPDGTPQNLILCDKIMRIRLDESLLSADFFAWSARSTSSRAQLSAASTGTSQSMVNIRAEDIRNLRLPKADLGTQARLVSEFTAAEDYRRRLTEQQQRHASLLQERITSLITAAVTGQFDVSTARKVAV